MQIHDSVEKATGGVKTKENLKLSFFRRLFQTAMLLTIGEFSFYGIFRCPFAIPYVSCSNCPVVQCPGRSMVFPFWMALCISALIFGRAFCGWACPVGFISGLLSKMTALGKNIGESIDKNLSFIKYGALALCLSYWLWLANPRWAIPIRTGDFFESVSLTFQHADTMWLTRTLSVAILILIGGMAGNLWCRYLCPTGGALDIFRKTGLFQFRKSKNCNHCGICRTTCEMDTEPERYNCINCGDCRSACPKGAIFFGRQEKSSYFNSATKR